MKKLTIMLAAVLLLAGLSACGREDPAPTTVPTTRPTTAPTTMPTIMPDIDPTLGTNIPDPSVDTSMPDMTDETGDVSNSTTGMHNSTS